MRRTVGQSSFCLYDQYMQVLVLINESKGKKFTGSLTYGCLTAELFSCLGSTYPWAQQSLDQQEEWQTLQMGGAWGSSDSWAGWERGASFPTCTVPPLCSHYLYIQFYHCKVLPLPLPFAPLGRQQWSRMHQILYSTMNILANVCM